MGVWGCRGGGGGTTPVPPPTRPCRGGGEPNPLFDPWFFVKYSVHKFSLMFHISSLNFSFDSQYSITQNMRVTHISHMIIFWNISNKFQTRH